MLDASIRSSARNTILLPQSNASSRPLLGKTGLRWLALAGVTAVLAVSVDAGFGPGLDEGGASIPTVEVPAVPPPPALVEPELAILRDVLVDYREGRIAKADTAIAGIAQADARRLAEWAALRNGTMPFDRIRQFLDANPDWPGRETLLRRAEEALLREAPDTKRVLAFFAGNRQPQSAGGRVALAFATSESGDSVKAHALARAAWHGDVLSQTTELRLLKAFGDEFEARDHRIRMEMLAMRDRWEDAARAAARIDADHVRLVELRRAVENAGPKRPVKFDVVPEALRSSASFVFSRARHERKQGNYREAAKLLAQSFPDPADLGDPDAWWTERRYLARELLDLNEPAAAYAAVAAQPMTPDATGMDAAFHAGWIALRFVKRNEEALAHFNRASEIATLPVSIARARYWQGRASEAAGRQRDAQQHYARAAGHPSTFYGQLARTRLGRSDLALEIRSRSQHDAHAEFHASPAGRALAILLQLDEPVLARTFYVDLAQSLDGSARLDALAETARVRRDARSSQMIGRIALARGFPLVDHAYPTFGVPSVELPSPRVERAMLHAIVRQESAFDVAARSRAGARGLMQLMPATARETAQKAKVPYEPERLTQDPAYNVTLGAAHLDGLLASLDGNLPLTFAAYNAGIGNVRRWIKAYGDPRDPTVDPVDWIERIPFAETRDYVQRVLENLQVYRVRLGEQTALLTETDLRGASARP